MEESAAEEQNDAAAMHAEYWLGVCYAKGQGVLQNEEEAIKWYQKSATQGCPHAQRALEDILKK